MNTITLIIKGDEASAIQAALIRGIPAAFQRHDSELDYTFLLTGAQHEKALSSWFGEVPHKPPYPNGTLLSYGVSPGEP